jgi:hypothetical protein
MATTTKTDWLMAREAVVVTVGARAPVYRTTIVRDRHSGKLAEVPLTEYPPLDPGSDGVFYTFKRHERVEASHPAVVTSPGSFIPIPADWK